jgi:hypothetical protein
MARGCGIESSGGARSAAEGSTPIRPAVAATGDVPDEANDGFTIRLTLLFVASKIAHPLLLLASSSTTAGEK